MPQKPPVKGRYKTCLNLLKRQNVRGKTILDVGCSHGWLVMDICEQKPGQVFGIDSDEKGITHAKKIVPDGKFFTWDAKDKLPIKSSSIDVATPFDVIEHVPKGAELTVLKNIHQVLKPNGTLLLSTPFNHWLNNITDPAWYFGHRHYSISKISQLVEDAGFKIQKVFIKGGIPTIIYMSWFYISKWLLFQKYPRFKLLEDWDDKTFDKGRIHTIFIVAKKQQ